MKARLVALPVALALVACLAPALLADEPVDTLRRSYPAAPGGKLVLKTDRGSLTLAGGDSETAEITVTRRVKRASGEKARKLLADHQVTFSQENGVIRVDADLKGEDGWGWKGPQLEVEISVSLPRRFAIDASTAGGSIHATRFDGPVSVHTSGGSLHLESITGTVNGRTSGGSIRASQLAGSIELSTAGGSINVEGVSGEQLKASTSGGSIKLSGISAPADIRTSGGSISLEGSGAPVSASTSGGGIDATFTAVPSGDILLKTSAGGIGVVLPATAAFQLDASTSAGSVRSEFPVPVTSSSENRSQLKGPVNGGGPTLKLRTSAGSIRVKKS